MIAAFRSPQVRAFEPSPETFEILRRAVGDHPGVTVEPLAMGDAQGVLPFHVTQGYSVNDSLLAPTWDVETWSSKCVSRRSTRTVTVRESSRSAF